MRGVVRGEGHRGSVLKDRIFTFRSTFFNLRVDPFLKGLCCSEKQTGKSQKVVSL